MKVQLAPLMLLALKIRSLLNHILGIPLMNLILLLLNLQLRSKMTLLFIVTKCGIKTLKKGVGL